MRSLLLLCFFLLISCDDKSNSKSSEEVPTTNVQQNAADWQKGFGLTHDIDQDSIWNKPVRFYFENKECDQTAKDFYYGKYRPTDEPRTAELLSLITTDNDDLRPFYRWILDKTIVIQDGALGEYTGVPARRYAEKFPNEFFEYMDANPSGEKYAFWTNSILYSGFYDSDNDENSQKMREDLTNTMISNCESCDDTIKERIKKFAKDCFPDILN